MFWTCSDLHIIFTYIPFKVQMFLTFWKPDVMFPFNFLAMFLQLFLLCCDIIYGISCIYSLGCLSCGNVICGIDAICLIDWTTSGTTLTIVGLIDGSTLPLIVFCALKSVLFCSLFTFELEALPYSTLFFLLKALLGKSVAAFFLFYSVIFISSLFLLTLASGFCGLSF